MNTGASCSFCGQHGDRKLVTGLAGYICQECLAAISAQTSKRPNKPAECAFCGQLKIAAKLKKGVAICAECVQRTLGGQDRWTVPSQPSPPSSPPAAQVRPSPAQMRPSPEEDSPCLPAERHSPELRTQVLLRLREAFDLGYRDPELLYLGGRYAASLGLADETRRFIEPLAKMLEGEGTCEASAPVGLVELGTMPLGPEREQRAAKLQGWASRLGIESALAGLDTAVPANGHANLGSLGRQLDALAPRLASDDDLKRLLQHGAAASTAYLADKSEEARSGLEALLRVDGDQIEVLRNLITLASEQQDAEAYERYWRRYVHALLSRILMGDEVDYAWAELTRFYLKVAVATDRDCKAAPSELSKLLPRPGFLPRWLESHAALVWLDTSRRPRWTSRAGLAKNDIEAGRKGYRALLEYWLKVFYPQFLPFLDRITPPSRTDLPPTGASAFTFPFDPAMKLARRCIEWAELQFMLQGQREGAHAEAVRALAGFVARLPAQPSLLRLAKDLGEDILRGRSPIEALCEATSLPFHIGLRDYLNPEEKLENWEGVVEYLGDPDLNVAPSLRMFAAFGMARSKRERAGLKLACTLLPELDAKQLADDAQEAGLWRGILMANLQKAGELDEQNQAAAEVAEIRALVAAIPDLPAIHAFRQARLDEVEGMLGQLTVRPILEKLGKLRRQSLGGDEETPKKKTKLSFDEIESDLAKMPESPASVKEIKQKLGEILRVERAVSAARAVLMGSSDLKPEKVKAHCASLPKRLTELVTFIARTSNTYWKPNTEGQKAEHAFEAFRRGDYENYRALARERKGDSFYDALRDLEPVHKEWRLTLAKWRMGEVGELDMPQVLVDTAVDESQFLTQAEEFDNAVAILKLLPDEPEQLAQVKRHLLGQVTQAATIGTWRKRISEGDFTAAKKIVDKLPETTPEEKQLKQQLREATASQQYVAEYKPVVDRTMAEVQSLVQAGDFELARTKIRGLRDDGDLAQLKRNVLTQLDQAEEQSREAQRVNGTMNEIQRLVSEHKVDKARKLAEERLPYEVREKIMAQLDQAAAHQKMDDIIKQLKDLMSKDRFREARRLLDDIPVHLSSDLYEVKENLSRQIDEAENGAKIKGQVEDAIKEIQGHVNADRFRDAERVIDRMPREAAELKEKLREQVNQAREQKELNGVVESTVAEIRKHVGNGDFYQARSAVDRLPYNSALDGLKKNLRNQIDEAESEHRKMESEIGDLMSRISRKLDGRNIDLATLARQNNVDLSSKPQLYGFLKAIDRQL